MTNPTLKPQDNTKSLSAIEYLWLQHEKHRLAQMDVDIIRLQNRQDRQSVWIAVLILTVIVLGIAILLLILL